MDNVAILLFAGILSCLIWGTNAQASEFSSSVHCLAKTMYHEARGQDTVGQVAVADVVMNRVNDKRFPDTICKVIYQAKYDSRGHVLLHQCQFSWYCDGKADVEKNLIVYTKLVRLAFIMLYDKSNRIDITDGSIFYHNKSVHPYWAVYQKKTVTIGNHVFYK